MAEALLRGELLDESDSEDSDYAPTAEAQEQGRKRKRGRWEIEEGPITEGDSNSTGKSPVNARVEAAWAALRAQGVGNTYSNISRIEATEKKTIEIEEERNFAGQLVTVTKVVEENSKEAKAYAQSQTQHSKIRSAYCGEGWKPKGLVQVLATLEGKKKMSVIEKSRFDWEGYKDEHKMAAELEAYKKNGFLERQDFLHRSSWRQFERERDIRLAQARARASQP